MQQSWGYAKIYVQYVGEACRLDVLSPCVAGLLCLLCSELLCVRDPPVGGFSCRRIACLLSSGRAFCPVCGMCGGMRGPRSAWGWFGGPLPRPRSRRSATSGAACAEESRRLGLGRRRPPEPKVTCVPGFPRAPSAPAATTCVKNHFGLDLCSNPEAPPHRPHSQTPQTAQTT